MLSIRVSQGGQGACGWHQEQEGCSNGGPGASLPSWLPGPAGAGMEEEIDRAGCAGDRF